MENSPELKALIRKNANLFWYIKDSAKEELPVPVVMEFFFYYADEESIKRLLSLVGKEKAAAIFNEQINKSERAANNYNSLSKNFFTLYFARNA